MQKVTIEDIARLAGVSTGTVSKVMNGDQTVKDKNRIAVQNAVAALNYNVNRAARRLAHNPIRLGILLPDVFDAYFDAMEQGIAGRLRSLADYRVTAVYKRYGTDEDAKSVSAYLRFFAEEKVDGIILGPMLSNTDDSSIRLFLQKCTIPVVLVLSDIPDSNRVSCVSVDATLSGQLAAELAVLASGEGAQYAVLVGDSNLEEHRLKAAAFRERIVQTKAAESDIFQTKDDPRIAYRITSELIRSTTEPKVIYVATGNSVAVCRAICDHAKEQDVRVIATDIPNGLLPFVENRIVIGVLHQHLEQIGSTAVYELYRYLTEGVPFSREIRIAPSLLLQSAIKHQLHM